MEKEDKRAFRVGLTAVGQMERALVEAFEAQAWVRVEQTPDCRVFVGTEDDGSALGFWVEQLPDDAVPAMICMPGLTHRDKQRLAKGRNLHFVRSPSPAVTKVVQRVVGGLLRLQKPAPYGGFLVGGGRAVRTMIERLEKFAGNDLPVLLRGESGVGKELCANLLHKRRGKGQKLSLNCASLKPELIESELFGHERGAFTGADGKRLGLLFEVGDGTAFLDEIGELKIDAQATLLRALEENKARPVGSNKWQTIRSRLVLATHRDLEWEIEEHRFREDLYHRINTLSVLVPPLRDRLEDLPLLVDFFVDKLNELLGKQLAPPTSEQIDLLYSFDWKGNIRQLHNWLKEAAVLSEEGQPLDLSSVQERILQAHKRAPSAVDAQTVSFGDQDTWASFEERARRAYFQAAYEKTRGSVKHMSELTGVKRSTLYEQLKKLDIGTDGS